MLIKLFKSFLFLSFFFLSSLLFAQTEPPILVDTLKLPFIISDVKRMDDEELSNKKEGITLAGVPDISSDPINGQGIGAEGSIYFNGKRTDPFFAYTPYRAALNIAVFITNKSQKSFTFSLDVPYIYNTKWRLRTEAAYSIDPNQLFFGITEKSLNPLSYTTSTGIVNNASFKNYENSLVGNRAFYNTYTKTEAVLNISGERSFLEGKLRLLIGYEIASIKITTPLNDSSLVNKQTNSGEIRGYGNNRISLLQTGIIYDTRNLETDPSKGIFAEITNEVSLKTLGSQYNFNKLFLHVNGYYKILPKLLKRTILCGSFGMSTTTGNAPFFEYPDAWSSEGDIDGLGGSKTLRGYKQARFAASVIQYSDIELRIRFLQFKTLKQHFAFSAVPFFDEGGVWDNLSRMNHLENLRTSEGMGLRIVWNTNSVLRFDYAVSKEDRQFFFQLGHAF